ncbi:hypothetical protein [Psittacicella gerlachiana]|uniref:Uncharacterized protein n=1 Tax=Psittacicella gerlachiana TaxID=2028574 RepID=A0A3A1Y9W4_9GAMM|nr:hypothetical protein [Psittacicella gerlachiana]RIY34019.1 hypothetical protein CKF59_05860 [Psittacicella gerlachiana]
MKFSVKLLSFLASILIFPVSLKVQASNINFTPTEATVYIRASFEDNKGIWHNLQEAVLYDIKNDYAKRQLVEYANLVNYFSWAFAHYSKPRVVNGRYVIPQLNEFFTLVEACTVYIGSVKEGLYIDPCKSFIAFASLYNNDPNSLATSVFSIEYAVAQDDPQQVVDLAKKKKIFNALVKNWYLTDDKVLLDNYLTFKPSFSWNANDVTDSSLRQSVLVWKSFFDVNLVKEKPDAPASKGKSSNKGNKSAT